MVLSLLAVGLASLVSAGKSLIVEKINLSAKDSADFVSDNLVLFREGMRKADPSFSDFSAAFVEKRQVVFVVEDGQDAELLDFDGRNGFALFGQGSEILAFAPAGDFEEPTKISAFSRAQGFGVIDSSGVFNSMASAENKRSDPPITSSGSGTSSSSFNNPEAYVKEKYGDGFTLQISTGKAQWIFREQSGYSVYSRQISPSLSEFEKNCQLASTYEVVDWYRTIYKISAIPSSMTSISPESDSFYQEFMSEKTSYGAPLYRVAHREVPSLYKEIRDWYIANDGYRFDGTHISKAADCVSYLSSHFSVGLSATSSSSYSLEQMKKDSVSGVATDVFFDSSGSIAHAMPVVGYQTYSKTSGWWIFQHTDYVTLLGVNDNVYPEKRYVDFTSGPSGSVLRVVYSA